MLTDVTREWVDSFTITKLSHYCMEDITNGNINRWTQTKIMQTLGQKMWADTSYPSSLKYTQVYSKLVTTHPILEMLLRIGL